MGIEAVGRGGCSSLTRTMFLILPAHKKYIKLLRDRVYSGNPVVTTQKDWKDFWELVKTTKQRLPRHQGLYRITLRAMNRPQEDVKTEDIIAILDNKAITIIENTLAKAEWKSLGATLTGAYVIPILRRVVKCLDMKQNKARNNAR